MPKFHFFSRLPSSKAILTSLIIALGLFVYLGSASVKAQSDNFFLRYGKHLPWGENSSNPNDFMVMTVNPNSHRAWYGYYAEDFAKNGGDALTLGIPVLAISDGILEEVRTIGYNGGYGRYIVINHLNGYKSQYNHMQLVAFNSSDIGKPIKSGQEIGTIGATGNVTGANLELVILDSSNNPIKATLDGIPFQGSYSWSQVDKTWVSPIDNFDKYIGSIFKSENRLRDDDPTPPVINGQPWTPPSYDALDNYLKYYGYMFPSGMVAEPVNSATGNFVTRKVDLDLNSQFGPELKFERFYNSQNDYIGFNGIGWSNNFDIKVIAHSDEKFSVKLADGSGETFQAINFDEKGFTREFQNITPETFSTLTRSGLENDFKFEYTSLDKIKYTFNSNRDSKAWGKVEKITSIDGKSLSFTYLENGNLSKVTDFSGRFISFDFGTDAILDSLTDSAGRSVSYSYNFDGFLNKVIYPLIGEWNYGYDSIGQIISLTDGTNKTYVTNTYDNRRVISQKDGNGNISSLEYIQEKDGNGNLTGRQITKFKDGNNNITQYIHDSNLYLIETIKPDNSTIKSEYNSKGQKTKEISSLGKTTSFEYDLKGNLIKQINASNQEKAFEYNELNLPTKVSDASGEIQLTYNSAGKILTEKNQLGNQTNYEYDSNNFQIKKTDARNKIKTFTYNLNGFLESENDPESNSKLTYIYDAAGNKVSVIDSLGRETKFEYNSFGKNTKIIDPKKNELVFEYEANGNLIKKTDESNSSTIYETDGNENITKVIYPNSGTEEFKFDANNNKTEEKDRNGNRKIYQYNNVSKVIQTQNFDLNGNLLKTEEYFYDLDGNQKTYKDGKNFVTSYDYDSLNNLVRIIFPDSSKKEFIYDNLNRIVAKKDQEDNFYKTEYDSLNRIKKETNQLGQSLEYNYDEIGNLILKTGNGKLKTEYSYDSANRLISLKNPQEKTSFYTYNAVGDLIQTVKFAGETQNFSYDENNNLISTADFYNNTTKFEYNSLGKVSKVIDPKNNLTQISYNSMGFKQKEIDALNNPISYEYDANGNLTKIINKDLSSFSTQYDGLNRTVSNIDELGKNENYFYDLNNNLIKYQDKNGNFTSFEFDSLNRKTKVIGPNNEIFSTEYSPNGFVVKQTNAENQITTFKNNALGQPEEITNAKNLTQKYLYNEFGFLEKESDYKNQNSTYIYDELGNIKSLTDRSGHKTTFDYDAESKLTKIQKPLNSITTLEYDKVGRLSIQTNPENRKTSYAYDSSSNIISITDGKDFTTNISYDSLNRKAQVSNPENGITKYFYSAKSQIDKIVDANGNFTSYIYNERDELTAEIDARNLPFKYEYDANGNTIKTIDRKNIATNFSYDNRNRLSQTAYADGGIEQIEYNENSEVISKTNALKSKTKYTYDSIGNLTSVTDRENFATNYSYDENNNLNQITDAKNAITKFDYNSNDLLIKQSDAYGKIKEYFYDDLNRLKEEINENSQKTKYEYNLFDELIKKVDAQNNIYQYSYDRNSNLIKSIDPLDRQTSYSYDKLNRLSTSKNADAKIKSYSYDNLQNIKSVKNENSSTQLYAYDSVYNLTKSTNALNYSTSYSYDANNNLINEVDANGNQTNYSYDLRNRLNSKQLPNKETYKNEYDVNGNLIKSINPKGKASTFEYTARDLIKRQTDQLNNSINYEYDSLGNLVKKTDAENNSTNYEFDLLQRLSTVTDPLKNKTVYGYDNLGNLIIETDPKKQTTKYEFNSLNLLTKEINPANNSTNYSYDKSENLTYKKDASGQEFSYNFDNLNRIISSKQLNTKNTDANYEISYDLIGNQTQIKNQNIDYSYLYDADNQLTTQQDSTGKKISYSYDKVGNRTGITYPDGTNAVYSYNATNQLSALTFEQFNGKNLAPDKLTTSFGYDENGNLTKQSNPNNTITNWAYDDADRLSGIAEKISLPITTSITLPETALANRNYSRNKNGDITKETIQILSADKSVCGSGILNLEKELENKKICNDEISKHTSEIVKNYTYDANSRLTSTKEDINLLSQSKKHKTLNSTEIYFYDVNGNRSKTSLTKDGKTTTTSFAYNNLNQLTSDDSSNYSYDKNGNLLQKADKKGKSQISYSYNSLNLLTSVSNKENDLSANYSYDALGRRIAKKVDSSKKENSKSQSNTSINYSYDGKSYESLNENSAKDYTNFYKTGSKIIASQTVEISKKYDKKDDSKQIESEFNRSDKSDKSIEDNKIDNKSSSLKKLQTPETNFYHYDNLGSVTGITGIETFSLKNKDKSINFSINIPTVEQVNYYDSWGVLQNDKIKKIVKSDLLKIENNKTYSGKEFDIESGAYYYGSRYYNPKTANWNKQDSYRGQIEDPMSRNRYAFVNNNPVNVIDVYGFSGKMAGFPNDKFVIPTNGCNIDRSCTNDTNPDSKIDSAFANKQSQMQNLQTLVSKTTNDLTSEKSTLNSLLPSLSAKITATKWNAYHAKVKYYDYAVLSSVINRLDARGYSLDYGGVYNYLGNQIFVTGSIYSQAVNSYYNAINNYSGALNRIGEIGNNINTLSQITTSISSSLTDLQSLYHEAIRLNNIASSSGSQAFNNSINSMQSIDVNSMLQRFTEANSTGFNKKFQQLFGTDQTSSLFAGKFAQGYNYSQTLYVNSKIAEQEARAAQEAFNKGIISFIKIGAAVIGGTACTVLTAGLALAGCVGLAGVVIANESVNLYDYNASLTSGVAHDTKANLLGNVMSQNDAKIWSGYINTGSDLALAGTITIATAGAGAVLLTGNAFTASGMMMSIITVPGAQEAIVWGSIGSFAGNYGNIYCLNTMQCSPDQIALNTLTAISGGGTIGQNAGMGTNLILSNQTASLPYSSSRPPFRNGVVQTTWKANKSTDGRVFDPNTGEELFWDTTKTRVGQWDMGHIQGQKYSDTYKLYANGTITKKQFLDWYNDPANYIPQSIYSNRSHIYE